ncbi:MAG: hypothetical protein NTV81_00890 [Candidatus Komeilibacteria bacterium]|nr:hypothetical protein [Candidatus Komeilibacteria bacterium]
MSWLKNIFWLISTAIVLTLLSWNMQLWHFSVLGWMLLFGYGLILSYLWQRVIRASCHFDHWPILAWLLGAILSLLLVTSLMAVVIVWYTTSPTLTWWCLLVAAIISLIFYYRVVRRNWQPIFSLVEPELELRLGWWQWLALGVYIIGWLSGWFFLSQSITDRSLLSPWQALSGGYIIVFFFTTVALLILLFSKLKTRWLLVLIFAYSLLTHGYLVHTSELPYGGDVWRHLGVEQQLTKGLVVAPAMFGAEAKGVMVAGQTLPAALLDPYKYSYGQYWALQVLFNQTTNLSLLTAHRFVLPLIWSLALPLLLFLIGLGILRNTQAALVLSLIASWLFPLQSLGALSTPVAWGLVMFLVGIWLLVEAFEKNNEVFRPWVIVWGLIMFFSYPLYFIVYWLLLVWLWFWRRSSIANFKQLMLGLITAIVSGLALPAIELLSGYSQFSTPQWLTAFKQTVSGLLAWHFVALTTGDNLMFNWLFNQPPSEALVSNFFITARSWVVIIMIIVWLLVLVGLIKSFTSRSPLVKALASLSLILFFAYLVDWFILSGERIFTRRLDLVFSLLIGWLIIIAWQSWRSYQVKFLSNKWVLLLVAIIVAWVAAATYSSGPDLRATSQSEYQLAQNLWQRSDQLASHHCVLADDWVLLVLEGVSGGKIVAGGFPLYLQYSQPERKKIMTEFQTKPIDEVIALARELTGSNRCLVASQNKIIIY